MIWNQLIGTAIGGFAGYLYHKKVSSTLSTPLPLTHEGFGVFLCVTLL